MRICRSFIPILLAFGSLFQGCGEALEGLKDAAEDGDLGGITFKGTVKNPEGVAIENATVRIIQLLDESAIKELIEYKKVPDGAGGEKDVIRVKFDSVHNYAPTYEMQTDAEGKFSQGVDPQLYLVYVFGPGAAPGTVGAYTVSFWGINPETGELDLDHLIGKDGQLTQENNDLTLAGGPTPPPAPAPAPPPPAPEPAVAEAATPTAVTVPEEPLTAADANRPEEIVPPSKDATFWSGITFTHSTGDLTTGTLADGATLPTDQKYFSVKGTLVTAQTDPVYLVIQTGFDTDKTPDCSAVQATAKSYIYPVKPNGTVAEYKLIPPGPYFRLFFAKTASRTDGGPITSTVSTEALTIGTRKCDMAIPKRPFLATLTWDKEADLDIHISKFDRSLIKTSPETAEIDKANWITPTGTTVSLDIDNIAGFGAENVGETAGTDLDGKCYKIQVHYYSGSGDVNASVDVSHSLKVGDKTLVEKYTTTKTLSTPGSEWWSVGTYPPDCEEEPAKSEVAATSCAALHGQTEIAALTAGQSGIYITANIEGADTVLSCTFDAGKKAETTYYSSFNYMPSNSQGTAFSVRGACKGADYEGSFWMMRAPAATTALDANTTTSAFPHVQLRLKKRTASTPRLKSPNVYGASKGGVFKSGSLNLETFTVTAKKVTQAKGCFTGTWDAGNDGVGGTMTGSFNLNF